MRVFAIEISVFFEFNFKNKITFAEIEFHDLLGKQYFIRFQMHY